MDNASIYIQKQTLALSILGLLTLNTWGHRLEEEVITENSGPSQKDSRERVGILEDQ